MSEKKITLKEMTILALVTVALSVAYLVALLVKMFA